MVLLLAALLQPFMPSFTAKLLAQLGAAQVMQRSARALCPLAGRRTAAACMLWKRVPCQTACPLHVLESNYAALPLPPVLHASTYFPRFPMHSISGASPAAPHPSKTPHQPNKPPPPPHPHPPHTPLQAPLLTDDLVKVAANPAALLPAAHPIGASEPTPLFR